MNIGKRIKQAARLSIWTKACLAGMLLGNSVHAAEGADTKVRFDRDIRPILSDACFHCHGPDDKHRKAKLRLDLKEHALADRDGIPAFKAGDLEGSEAWQLIISDDPDDVMPPKKSNKTLTAKQKDLIKRWIEQGANWTDHWAFVPPTKQLLPKVSDPKWPVNPIDRFVMAKLDSEDLKPQPEAARHTLIRRLSFDLTGMPPKPKDVDAFVNDKSPNAYEKVVDRLLASPQYGERMAVMWLDAARYGDTSVFHADGPRDMWAWRDGVVQSYNKNKPFDQFSIEQLAGDSLPNPTIEQRVASGFNRNNGTTDEGGLIPEEYRVEYAVDRVKTTSMVWLGLSMECAQCHDHKYDPISQKEYYSFYAFFNVSADGGSQSRRGNSGPQVSVPNPMSTAKLPAARAKIATINKQIAAHGKSIDAKYKTWLAAAEKAPRTALPLPGSPLAHFTFDENKGKAAIDAAMPKRKATFKGKAQWTKGKLGAAIKLDGRTYLDAGNIGDFERTDKFSYGCWIYPTKSSAGAPIARMHDGGGYRGYDLYVANFQVAMHLINSWPNNALKVTTNKKLKVNQWQHVFVTYDGSSKAAGVKIYVNGEKWDWRIEQDRLSATTRTTKPLFIGSRNPGSRFNGLVDDVRIFSRTLTQADVSALAGADMIGPILAKKAADRTKAEQQTLRSHYLTNIDPDYAKLQAQLAKAKAEESALLKPVTTVMIMQDMAKPRATYVLERGAYDAPNKEKKVDRQTPTILPPMAEGLPRNRLGMAKWLFQENHPLTARVAVNRYWQMLFGIGLVDTPSDFGSQGSFPTHPKLLDWLAVDFRENGWDVKRMIKQLVMSATYRQSSSAPPRLYKYDAGNRLLARGSRFRLQGEFIRDTALDISGLLVPTMGGRGVKPYQPPGLWKEVGLSGKPIFRRDNGEKLYRRSLYTYWKRSAPPPNMMIFDAPTREKCTVSRPRTNTPLQALVTMNDVQFVEAARNLAQRMLLQGGKTPNDRIAFAFKLATSRQPNTTESAVLLDLYNTALAKYKADPDAAKKLIAFGESKPDPAVAIDFVKHAAWATVASTIMNLDETLTRE